MNSEELRKKLEDIKSTRVNKYFTKYAKDYKIKQLTKQITEAEKKEANDAITLKLRTFTHTFKPGVKVTKVNNHEKHGVVISANPKSFCVDVEWPPPEFTEGLSNIIESSHYSVLEVVK